MAAESAGSDLDMALREAAVDARLLLTRLLILSATASAADDASVTSEA